MPHSMAGIKHIFKKKYMPIQIISLKCKISLVSTSAIHSGYTTSCILIIAT